MYFLQQFLLQFFSGIFVTFQEGPGNPGWTAEAATERARQEEIQAAKPEEERLVEMQVQSTETTAQMRTRLGEERARSERIARSSAAEAIADTDNGGSGNPEGILAVAPANNGERLAAEAAVTAAGGDVADEAAVNAAIVAQRGEKPGETRELTPEEQTTVRAGLLAGFAGDVGIDAATLTSLYDFNAANNPDFNSETIGADMERFANEMDIARRLTERVDGLEMPTTQEGYNRFMKQLEQFRDANGNLEIPLTPEEIAAMGIEVDDEGNITIRSEDGTVVNTYSGNDAPPGMPRTSGGNVVSGNTGGARYEGGANSMDIDIENLTPGVDGLIEMIYEAEAGGDPDIIYGGSPIQPPQPITEMTVREVRQFQDEMVRAGSASSAVGACQVIRGTMDGAINSGLLNPDEKFNVDAQRRFTVGKLNERGLQRFIDGDPGMDEMALMRNISMEWASFPKDMSGASYYAGDGLNRAGVSPQTVLAQLRTIREGASSSEATEGVTGAPFEGIDAGNFSTSDMWLVGDSLSVGMGRQKYWGNVVAEVGRSVTAMPGAFESAIQAARTRGQELPRVVSIMGGTNNGGDVNVIRQNYERMISIARREGISIVLPTLPPIRGRELTEANAYIRGLASQADIRVVELADNPLGGDGVHFRGYSQPAQEIYSGVISS